MPVEGRTPKRRSSLRRAHFRAHIERCAGQVALWISDFGGFLGMWVQSLWFSARSWIVAHGTNLALWSVVFSYMP